MLKRKYIQYKRKRIIHQKVVSMVKEDVKFVSGTYLDAAQEGNRICVHTGSGIARGKMAYHMQHMVKW